MGEWVDEWVSGWVGKWVSGWVGELVSECRGNTTTRSEIKPYSCKEFKMNQVEDTSS